MTEMIEYAESDNDEGKWEVSTAHSSSLGSILSISEYSCQPSETAVDVADSFGSSLSLTTCATSVSEYSMPPSETAISFSDLNVEGELRASNLDLSSDNESVYSEYSLAPSETAVEVDTCEMLYPQRYMVKLEVPERAECDTRAPPKMFA